MKERIIEIIIDNFPNGIRDDFIAANKIRRIYSEIYSGESVDSDFIINIIRENGIEDNGRFYFISNENLERIRRLVNGTLNLYPLAYYSSILKMDSNIFQDTHIISHEVLKKFLQKFIDGNFYFDEFCSANENIRLDDVIFEIFSNKKRSLSIEYLKSVLTYVPEEKILEVLSDSKTYLPTHEGKYMRISEIQFDTDEIEQARQQISSCLEKNDCATSNDYDLSTNFALNYELDEKDLLNVIYEKFFAQDFIKRGKNFYKKNDVQKNKSNPLNDLQNFIDSQTEVSLERLSKFGIDRKTILFCARSKMIQVEENFFVKDSLIKFDVDGVDESLDPFVQNKIIPLRAVTSFTGFPAVEGYSWNLYLLESFLRKYSKKFVFNVSAHNNSNVGAIYPNSMKFKDYFEVQAAVLIQEKVPLEKSAVADFLTAKGFRGRSDSAATKKILRIANDFLTL